MRHQSYEYEKRLFETLTENALLLTLTSRITDMDSQPAAAFGAIEADVHLLNNDHVDILLPEGQSFGPRAHNICQNLVIIESRIFLRECLQRSIQAALAIPVEALSSIADLEDRPNKTLPRLVIVCLADSNGQEGLNALGLLSELAPSVPTIILTSKYNFDTMRAVISCGAKAYIPMSVGFEIAIEAVRFVLAGGTYVPAECLLSAIPVPAPPSSRPAPGAITSRELAVVRAIQQGKSNKIIAYDLNMCEATVKVHVRHIMKKLHAKNRTDVAIKAAHILACSNCTGQSACWSVGHCQNGST
jgi:DNA-binding NarL/FixJ family response regulator